MSKEMNRQAVRLAREDRVTSFPRLLLVVLFAAIGVGLGGMAALVAYLMVPIP